MPAARRLQKSSSKLRKKTNPAVMAEPVRRLLARLIARDIRSRFIGSASGWIWLILTPLLLLAVYGFVFGVIFRARVPDGLDIPFVAWLAVALWPWLAFSEGALRGSRSILEHSALISKVAIRRELLVISSVTSAFLLHLAGYLVVLLASLAGHAHPFLRTAGGDAHPADLVCILARSGHGVGRRSGIRSRSGAGPADAIHVLVFPDPHSVRAGDVARSLQRLAATQPHDLVDGTGSCSLVVG
jgi:hypothetical protein